MRVYTDDIEYAGSLLPEKTTLKPLSAESEADDLEPLLRRLFGSRPIFGGETSNRSYWEYLFIVRHAPESHYDLVADMSRENKPIPDKTLLIADSGDDFHGFKGRPWAGLSGNIHLVAYISPNQAVDHVAVGFTVLAAVSVVQTVDMIESLRGRAGIKWVNDILVDRAKFSGVLSFSQAQGNLITGAAVGIGLNVETTPQIPPSDFVPVAGALRQFDPESKIISTAMVFNNLIDKLADNIRLLLGGEYMNLLETYRERSVIVGRRVSIRNDTDDAESNEICSGRVESIDENLQLHLKGRSQPVSSGRLVLIF